MNTPIMYLKKKYVEFVAIMSEYLILFINFQKSSKFKKKKLK